MLLLIMQAAANRALTADDINKAVGQLGDNVLLPVNIDQSKLCLEQGEAVANGLCGFADRLTCS